MKILSTLEAFEALVLKRASNGVALSLLADPTESDISLEMGIAGNSNSYKMTYHGTGSGNTNAISLASSTKTLYESYQDGIVNFPEGLKKGGLNVLTTSDTAANSSKLNGQLASYYSPTTHTHGSLYYTESEVNSLLNGKVDNAQVLTNVPSGAKFTDTVYSHPSTHPISVVSGLQTALNGKVDNAQVLTNVPAGAKFTDTNTIYTHPSTHPISVVSGLQTALNGKVDNAQVLTNVPAGAKFTDTNTIYTHPSTHPATIITEDSSHRFVTDANKSFWDGKPELTKKVSTSITASSWVANSGDYPYKKNHAISGVLSTDEVNINILPDYLDIASGAEMAPYCEEYNGGITLYSKSIPSGTIVAKYTIWR